MKIIGLTGRSGSGKSTVAAYYRSLGYCVADGDLTARQVLQPGSPCAARLARQFGSDILDRQGAVKRKLLAQRAYAQPGGAETLVEVTHPEIVRRLLEQAQQAQSKGEALFFVDGAVIVGAPFERHCDAILLVTAPQIDCINRICARDKISERDAVARLNAQLSEERLRAAATLELRNQSDEQTLLRQAKAALEQLKTLERGRVSDP